MAWNRLPSAAMRTLLELSTIPGTSIPGNVFVAMRGESSNGNKFIDKAIASGAVAIVTDSAEEKPREGVAWAQVKHGRQALAAAKRELLRASIGPARDHRDYGH